MGMVNRRFIPYREVQYIFWCLAVVLLSCTLKNYLTYFLNGTEYCQYLCPSSFDREVFSQPELLNQPGSIFIANLHLMALHPADKAIYSSISVSVMPSPLTHPFFSDLHIVQASFQMLEPD